MTLRVDSLSRKPLALVIALWCVTAHAAEPVINLVLPRGAQRGAEIQIDIRGARLADVLEIMFDRPGIKVIELNAVNENRVLAKVKVAPDCMLGPHALRLRTAGGISNLRTLSIGALPELNEVEPNNMLSAGQKIELDSTINGVADVEDLDVFEFEAQKGERVTAEIEGIRLGDTFFDPYLAILDSAGFELATCDDAALLRQDAVVSVIIPEDGIYYASVRESSYAGNGNCRYRLHIGRFPRPLTTFPVSGRPGETLTVKLLGGIEDGREVEITLPNELIAEQVPGGWTPAPGVVGVFIEDEMGVAPSPNFFRLTNLEAVLEQEPNNARAEATTFTAPAMLNGVIGSEGDRDRFRFPVKQGQQFLVTVYARQIRSPLDSVLRVFRAGQGQVAANDDTLGPDSRLQFTANADGELEILLHDQLGRGGAEFTYCIEVIQVQPRLVGQLPRKFEYVTVPRGNRMATIVTTLRQNFGGDINLTFDNLPEGVMVTTPVVPGTVPRIPVVFSAADDAPLEGALSQMNLEHADANRPVQGGYRQHIEQVLGRNRVVFQAHTVDRVPVVVAEPAPFSIDIVEPKAPLVQSGTMRLLVRATRAEGFDGAIRLRVPFVPPGVGAGNSVSIAQGQDEATIPINANGNATIGAWPIVVLAEARTPRGTVRTSSQLVMFRVASPYLSFTPQATTVEQGRKTTMYVRINRLTEFEGDINVTLQGLPNKVSAEPLVIEPGVDEFTFAIETAQASPPGRHRNVFCLATILIDGEPVVHRLPAGELRIEKPLPPRLAEAAPKPKPDPSAQKTQAKPPTRLEKLRQEYEARKHKGEQDSTSETDPPKENGDGDS